MMTISTVVVETPKQAAKRLMAGNIQNGYKPEALHIYNDLEGNPLHWRIRMKHSKTGEKLIRPMRCIKGTYELKEPEYPNGKPLYNLHLITKRPDDVIWLVEGEKCADELTNIGLLATTSGGADSVDKTDWQSIAGREVMIWPDNDVPGLEYADKARAKLKMQNCQTGQLDIAQLNLPVKGDCVDWLQQFQQTHGRNAEKADIEALALKPDAIQSPTGDYLRVGDTNTLAHEYNATVSLQCAADIKPEAIRWLWDGWLAKGKLHIFAGTAGTGKTTISIALAATITTGGKFPDGSPCPAGCVLIWSGEDSPADTLIPRLMAAGADLNKVHFIGDTLTADYESRSFDPATDMQALVRKAAGIPDLALLIIDPIVNAVAGDSHKNGEVRRALQPVVDFGERLNCAVLGITHFSKGGQGKDPLERVTGSLAFGALARIVLATAKINDGDSTRRIFCRAKSNIGIDNGGFEYDLQQKEVQAGIFSSYALWGEAIEGSARELLAEPDNREVGESGNNALDDAKDFLQELLADGELPQRQIEVEAKGAGHSWRTVRRAKDELHIKSVKSKLEKCWYWRLTCNMAKKSEDVQHDHINNMDTLDTLPMIGQLATAIHDDVAVF